MPSRSNSSSVLAVPAAAAGGGAGSRASPTEGAPPAPSSVAASISAPAAIACLVIGLALCLNLTNLGFLTLDHSSTHDYHNEIVDQILGFGVGGRHHVQIKDDDEDTTSRNNGVPDDNDDVNLDDDKVLDEIEKVEDLLDADESAATQSGHLDEVHAFKTVISRAVANLEVCNSLPKIKGPPTKEVQQVTDTPMLSEFGIMNALSEWIGKVEGEKNAVGAAAAAGKRESNGGEEAYPMCHLPPVSSCQTKTYSVILMSHATDRLSKLKGGVVDLSNRNATEEVILVWNSPRSLLESDSGGIGQELLRWDEDPTNKLRIFFALENGLENNLLNRYHPSINPKSEAIMYFDDDGPFFDENAMSKVGFELWRRNSDVQNAAFPRNLRVLSDRMKDMQKQGVDLYLKSVLEAGKEENADDADQGVVEDVPFTPTCRERTGDIIEYNYFVFPQFGANMALPSGSIIHRNYLCFIWHPAFEELRKYIREHPTHPDDQTVSAIISQLSGKPPRAFPRTIKKGLAEDKTRLRGGGGEGDAGTKAKDSTKRRRLSALEEELYTDDHDFFAAAETEQYQLGLQEQLHVDHSHRRLLWQQKNWGPMREEAANSLIGYFGSLNGGSVGWCAGTQYQKSRPRSPGGFSCEPEFPTLEMIPWIQPGGVGYDICKD